MKNLVYLLKKKEKEPKTMITKDGKKVQIIEDEKEPEIITDKKIINY